MSVLPSDPKLELPEVVVYKGSDTSPLVDVVFLDDPRR